MQEQRKHPYVKPCVRSDEAAAARAAAKGTLGLDERERREYSIRLPLIDWIIRSNGICLRSTAKLDSWSCSVRDRRGKGRGTSAIDPDTAWSNNDPCKHRFSRTIAKIRTIQVLTRSWASCSRLPYNQQRLHVIPEGLGQITRSVCQMIFRNRIISLSWTPYLTFALPSTTTSKEKRQNRRINLDSWFVINNILPGRTIRQFCIHVRITNYVRSFLVFFVFFSLECVCRGILRGKRPKVGCHTHTHTHVEIFIHSDMPVSDGARLGHVRERAKAGEKLMSSSCEVWTGCYLW